MRAATADAAARAEDQSLSPVFVLVFLALIIPIFFSVGSLHMSLSRLVLLILTPILTYRLLAGQYGRVLPTDWLMLAFMFWFALSTLIKVPESFVTFVGSNMLILLGGYLTARAYVRGPRSFRQFTYLYGGVILVSLPFAIHEGLTDHMAIARLLDQIPGIRSSPDVNYGLRRGIYRVQVVFTHPIHYGLFCTMAFGLVFVGLRDRLNAVLRWLWGIAIGACCFLSVSSGPLMGIMAQVGLIVYGSVAARWMSRPWLWLLRGGIAGYVLLDLASSRPAYFVLAERIAFNPGTAYARKTLIDFGTMRIKQNPLFGIGAGRSWGMPSWMTGSADNQWLLIAVVYGVPAFAFLFGAYVLTLWKVGKAGHDADPETRHLQLGWSIMTFGTMLSLATVAVWSDIATLAFVTFGCGVWFVYPRDPSAAAAATPEPAARGMRYSRYAGEGRAAGAVARTETTARAMSRTPQEAKRTGKERRFARPAQHLTEKRVRT